MNIKSAEEYDDWVFTNDAKKYKNYAITPRPIKSIRSVLSTSYAHDFIVICLLVIIDLHGCMRRIYSYILKGFLANSMIVSVAIELLGRRYVNLPVKNHNKT